MDNRTGLLYIKRIILHRKLTPHRARPSAGELQGTPPRSQRKLEELYTKRYTTAVREIL